MFQNQPVLEEEFAYCEEIIEEPEQTTEEQDTQFEDDLMAQYKGKYLGFFKKYVLKNVIFFLNFFF